MSTRRATQNLAAALLAAIAVVAVSCGDATVRASATSNERGPTPTGDVTPVAVVLDAVAKSAEQSTVLMTMRVTVDGEELTAVTSQSNADGSTARMTMDIPVLGEIQVLVVDGDWYFAVPDLPDGKDWVRRGADQSPLPGMDSSPSRAQDPNQVFGILATADEDAVEVGTETIDGVPTTHYRLSVDVGALLDELLASGAVSDDDAAAIDGVADRADVEVWIDDDELVRRMTYEVVVDGAMVGAPGPASLGYEYTFGEYGEPLDVAAPAPATVLELPDPFSSGD